MFLGIPCVFLFAIFAGTEILDAIVEAIQGVFFGGVSPEDAAKTAAEKMEVYIATR